MENTKHTHLQMEGITKGLIVLVIIVHLLFFLLEAVFWMIPEIHATLIDLLNNPVDSGINLQALTLRNLFINQGCYNLFLVCEGIGGLMLIQRGKVAAGYMLLIFLCFSATGAGIVLACSTKAYILAIAQALPAAITLSRLYPAFKSL